MALTVKLNYPGIRAMLRSPGVQADVARRAAAVAARAGEGFESDSQVGANRARASASTGDYASRLREAREHVLLGALDAAR